VSVPRVVWGLGFRVKRFRILGVCVATCLLHRTIPKEGVVRHDMPAPDPKKGGKRIFPRKITIQGKGVLRCSLRVRERAKRLLPSRSLNVFGCWSAPPPLSSFEEGTSGDDSPWVLWKYLYWSVLEQVGRLDGSHSRVSLLEGLGFGVQGLGLGCLGFPEPH
jgi:hypothetical protein